MTAQGWLDFGRQTMDLRGTIVPAYFFNALLGRMPMIGHLFSPEPGGGLFAATYSLRGPIESPAVGVNPLAALTPGAMRGLFGLFD
ncbi:MAG: AsmA-like C-terminal region-containing protein [Acetobacteraceae bacterium]